MEQAGHAFNLTKIIATLGPASSSEEIIGRLIQEGVDVFRINFSHGRLEEYEDLLNKVRHSASAAGAHVAVLGDLPGPKIRLGEVEKEGFILEKGQVVEFVNEPVTASGGKGKVRFTTNYPALLDEVRPGERILIDDGSVSLVCREISGRGFKGSVTAEVTEGGRVASRKGVNLPDSVLSLPSLTERDEQLVRFAVEKGFDYLALSFVRSAKDIRRLKELLASLGARPKDGRQGQPAMVQGTHHGFVPVISKIEKPQAVQNLEEIVEETDAVMVARGDLGVEMDLAEVAVIQKKIIHSCRAHGVPVIVATQMLQSMIDSPVPTRAEVSDVANAIFDGTDAVMLSGETAMGKYPVEAVKTMNRIAVKTNQYICEGHIRFEPPSIIGDQKYRVAAMAASAKALAEGMKVKFIGVWSELGGSAGFLSQYRIPAPVMAFSPDERTLRLLSLLYGLQPVFMSRPGSGREFIAQADALAIASGWAEPGDATVFVFREPLEKVGLTNQIALHFVGDKP